MSSVLRNLLKIGVPTALCLLLATTSFGQLSLRRALDVDGDNKADLSVYRASNSTWYTQSAAGFRSVPFGVSNSDQAVPGDYDGDGKGDVAVWRDTDGVFYFLRSSNGTFGAVQWGVTGDEPVARNWDSDNRTDFAVVRRTNNQIIWYILNSTNGSFRAEQFGIVGDFVMPGDYDGDGRFDLAVQRAASTVGDAPATIFIQQSGPGGFTSFQYGFGRDFFAPGDYNGDGRTDVMAVRESGSNLIWFLRDTTTGGISSIPFGVPSTDFIVQNDYDGDNKTDLAVWRDTTGVFYILNSSSNNSTIRIEQFGLPSDFPIAGYDTH